MANTVNFNTLKKKYLTVTLPDERNTVLMITTPTKDILDAFLGMKDSLTEESMGDEAIDELYGICARIMSRNKGGVKVTKDMIEKVLDFEDIIIFIRAYTEFINEVTSAKNF